MSDAIKLAIDALESVAIALPLNRGTVKTCYAINDIHRDAVHAALAALRAQPAGWIAVSERLPKPWDAVMVHPRPNDYVNEAYLNHKGVWMYSEYVTDFGDQAYPCVVTHWMPLPPPPGQERAQPDHSELVKDMRSFIELWKYVSPNPSTILTRAADALEGKL